MKFSTRYRLWRPRSGLRPRIDFLAATDVRFMRVCRRRRRERPYDVWSDPLPNLDFIDLFQPKRIKSAVGQKRDGRRLQTPFHMDEMEPFHLVQTQLKRAARNARPPGDLLLGRVAVPVLIRPPSHRSGDPLDVRVKRGVGVRIDEVR